LYADSDNVFRVSGPYPFHVYPDLDPWLKINADPDPELDFFLSKIECLLAFLTYARGCYNASAVPFRFSIFFKTYL